MTFRTHELPLQYKCPWLVKILLTILGAVWSALMVTVTVVCAIEAHDVVGPILLIILPQGLLAAIWIIILRDMKKAFIEVSDNKITAVDYYFGIRREKTFVMQDIVEAEITSGYSMRVRGYRFSGLGFSSLMYIVFRGNCNKYLFKLICSPETKAFFEKNLEIKKT